MSKKEREIREFEMDLKNFFFMRSNLRDDDNFCPVKIRSENEYGFGLVWSENGFSKCRNSVDSTLCSRNHNRSSAKPFLFS